ncbi:PIG-L family deacetylase [Nonomuraea muscovyensis]|uniref:LmbE family N-acetylglucosaminyl deacetylase n=1 Tax=Nonomuraea muscovyensis TaxID=1124761 RepID=A0A7X0F303_9ACTN|nr:PIG-L family deacetylase [Nonomuraea muscovyensis]MBB6352159.1 LmbE family N-acetylglucosaminyl deacetylase [Nonomuraea muscovyensis]MDF2706747.1 GlcNAc-PI de-N-acetylase [Nonomuraea muscovyensis]
MDRQLTLMAVHAHPDDECLSTGGVLARYAADGVRTVLVTCTNGEQGDGPGGVKPGEPGHDDAAVAERRLAELRESVSVLGIGHLELLGYRDSGMDGWETNHHPDAFANVPVETAAARLGELIEHYRPDVVVTYDETGGSGYFHPDHVQAHRITVAAVEATGVPAKFYYTAITRSAIKRMFELMRESGADLGDFRPSDDFGTPDEQVTTVVDVAPYVERKLKALMAHESQGESIFLLRMPEEAQQQAFSHEAFTRVLSRVATPAHEDDLFAGLRP